MTEEIDDPRPITNRAEGEAATLIAFLDYQRMTLEWKCSRLDDAALAVRLPTSALSLGGMLRHLTRVEDYWFSECLGRLDGSLPPWDTLEWAAEWDDHVGFTGEELRAEWDAAILRSRAVVDARLAESPDALDVRYPAWGGNGSVTLRWVLVHMVEEYARHNGHADLLREAIDGEVGE
ncbi:MAG: DinB family protein [Candidatus Nanopelagicales bacterium]